MFANNKMLKLSTTALFGLLAVVYCFNGARVSAFSSGPPIARTGAPALGTFPAETTCSACHNQFALNSGPGTLAMTGLPATYSANQEVAVTVMLTQPSRVRYGFEATALDDQGRKAGTLVVTDAARTQLKDGTGNFVGRQYIQHTLAGVTPSGADQNVWTFTWRAPAQSVGRVTFYVAGNGADGSGTNQGDYVYNINASVQPAVTIPAVSTVSAASFAPSGMLTTESIASIFGSNLASSSLSAPSVPLPIDLGGVKVKVRDNVGTERDAGLFSVTPGQINYLIPTGTVNGTATVTVVRDSNIIGAGNVVIDTIAPGLFAANMNGQGVAAAVVMRIKATGEQSFEPVARFDATLNRLVAAPIELGAETDQLFLILYGTGFRARTALSAVTAQIGGTNAEVLFAGAAPGFAGLDQANLRLPRSLAGRGEVNVALTVNNKTANTVTINVH